MNPEKKPEDQKRSFVGIDGLLLLTAVVLLAGSLFYFFQDDGLTTASQINLTPVGKFSTSRNDVRRRLETGFSWATVSPKDKVYEGDNIFTGDDSSAMIELNSGGQILIDPKSLVVVRTQGDALNLDLQYGSLVGKVQNDGSLTISQNGKVQQLSGKDAEFRILSNGPDTDTQIEVVKGEVTLKAIGTTVQKKKRGRPQALATAPQGPAQIIKQNEVANLSAKQAPVIKKITVELVSPKNGKSFWLAPGEPVNFSWKIASASKSFSSRIEFSKDGNFAAPFASLVAKDTNFKLVPDDKFPLGQVQWRVRAAIDGSGPSSIVPSSPSNLTLYPDVPPSPIFPADNQEFAINPDANEKGKVIALNWEDKAGSTEFEVQVSKDAEFKTNVLEKKTKLTNETTEALPPGNYFFRVKGVNPERLSAMWSRTIHFGIEEEAKQPEAPKLASKLIEYEIPKAVLNRVPASGLPFGRGVGPERLTPFKWQPVSHAESYEVEVAAQESFTNSIKQDLSKETSFGPLEIKPGTLFVRVRAKGRKGMVSPPSEVGKLEVSLPAPTIEPIKAVTEKFKTEDELNKARHEFALKWNTFPFADTYELQWGSDPEFTQSKKFRLKRHDRSFTVTKAMDYAARVRALGSDGNPISPFSETAVATYKKELLPKTIPLVKEKPKPVPPPLVLTEPAEPRGPANTKVSYGMPVPNPLEPTPKASLVLLENAASFVTFKWQPSYGAKSYELQVAEDADFAKIVKTYRTRSSSFTVQEALPEGKVFWRVRGVNKKTTSEWSIVNNLNVLYE